MRIDEITEYLKENIQPLKEEFRGNRYRAAAHLQDGTYLPCVVFESKKVRVDLAMRRFEQERSKKSNYETVVGSFIAGGSRVADYQLKDVELSPFAWPTELLGTIHGETVMSWTAFVTEMKDGSMHSYGSSYNFEFFDLPNGYAHSDIAIIHSGMIYSQADGLRQFSMEAMKDIKPYREKPFFTCYMETLAAPK